MAEIILKGQYPIQMYMGAALMTNPAFQDAEVRLAGENEESNVTKEMVRKFCPSWAKSTLLSLVIQCKVLSPILDDDKLTLKEKLEKIKDSVTEMGVV